MKLNSDFFVHESDGRAMLVATAGASFNGMVQGNKTLGAILKCLEKGATEEEILAALEERFDGDPDRMRKDVADVLEKLRSIGALDE